MAGSSNRTRSRRSSRKSAFGKGGTGRKFAGWLLGILAILLLLLVAGYYQALAYLQSDAFRALMEEKLSNKGKTEKVTLVSPLDIDGNRLTLAGGEILRKDACKRIVADNISAEVNRRRLWDGCLAFSKINAESISLLIDTASTRTPLPPSGQDTANNKDGGEPGTQPVSLPPSPLNRMEITEAECRDTNVRLDKEESTLLQLLHCSVKAEPARPGDFRSWNILLTGGKASTGFSLLREFGVKTASISIDEKRIRMQRCALQLTPGVGELRAAGEFNLQSKAWQAQLEVTKADLGILLTETWRRRVKGTLFGNLLISGQNSQVRSGRGDISLSDAIIEGLPILSDLPIGNTSPYRTIELESAECAISFPFSEPQHHIQNAWLFDHIDMRAKGDKLRVTGRILVGENKQLAGTLRVGLPDAAVSLLESVNKDVVQKIFNAQGAPGFRWLTVNLSGTIDNPVEDLSARLRTQLLSALPETAGKAADQAVRSLGGALSAMLRKSSPRETPATAPDLQPTDSHTTTGPSSQQHAPNPQQRNIPAGIIDSSADAAAEGLRRGLRNLFK